MSTDFTNTIDRFSEHRGCLNDLAALFDGKLSIVLTQTGTGVNAKPVAQVSVGPNLEFKAIALAKSDTETHGDLVIAALRNTYVTHCTRKWENERAREETQRRVDLTAAQNRLDKIAGNLTPAKLSLIEKTLASLEEVVSK